jgi:hypothetical protein
VKPEHAGKLAVERLTLKEANSYVAQFHRHCRPVPGHKFSLGILRQNMFMPTAWARVGAAIVGRPVARMLDDGATLEVRRLVIAHREPNACSKLLGACRRIAKAAGFKRLITYTLERESGASLRGAGWKPTAKTKGGSWSNAKRPRTDRHDLGPKIRWEAPI